MRKPQHVTDSGTTVLGHFPQYISKAKRLGASYFSIGDDWDAVEKQVDPFKRLNIPFLENRMAAGDRILLSDSKQNIRPGSALANEIEHLVNNGYKWVNQWALVRK